MLAGSQNDLFASFQHDPLSVPHGGRAGRSEHGRGQVFTRKD